MSTCLLTSKSFLAMSLTEMPSGFVWTIKVHRHIARNDGKPCGPGLKTLRMYVKLIPASL